MANTVSLGNPFRTQRVAIGINSYNANATVPTDIPRGLLLKSLKLRFSGSVTVAAGPATSLTGELPLPLLQRIELTADGRKPFISTDGRSLYRSNQFFRGKAGELSTNIAVANGTYNFVAFLTIDLEALRFGLPIDSYMDTRLYDGLQLKITYAPSSSMFVLGAATATINAGTQVSVSGEYTAEGFDYVKFNRIQITDEITVTAVSNSLRLDIPRNGLLTAVQMRSDIDNIPVDTLINNVTIRSENSVYHLDHVLWSDIQAHNMAEYQLDSGTFASRITGYGWHDFSEDAMLSSALDTTSLNTLSLLFDVAFPAGTTRLIRVLYNFFEPVIR